MLKLDILVLPVHPDDAELGCAGTILKHIQLGHKVGIADFTRGELGTRGSAEIRDKEAAHAAAVLGIDVRENLELPDGFFENTKPYQLKVIEIIRKYKPEIIITNAYYDRHPDHGRGAQLVADSCFYSGLRMVETLDENGRPQEAWRPKNVFHSVQDRYIKPDFVVDITAYHDQKLRAIRAFKSQFHIPEYDAASNEPQSYISSPDFLEFTIARAREMGHSIGVTFGEGFTTYRKLGVRDLSVFI